MRPKFRGRVQTEHVPFDELDSDTIVDIECAIGRMVLRLPLIARHLGHKNPLSTLMDYVKPPTDDGVTYEATTFLKDLLTMKTPELIAKWYGDITDTNWYAHWPPKVLDE